MDAPKKHASGGHVERMIVSDRKLWVEWQGLTCFKSEWRLRRISEWRTLTKFSGVARENLLRNC